MLSFRFYHEQIDKYLTRQSEDDRTIMATDRYKVITDKISSHVIQEDETTASMNTSKSKESNVLLIFKTYKNAARHYKINQTTTN